MARRPAWLIHSFVLAAVTLPYFVNLGVSSLWDSNEAFYAETPREMMVTGDYVAPQFNFQTRAQKPPLTYWIVVLSYKLFGIREFSVRLPGALAAAGAVLFTYGLARNLFGTVAGLMAAVILSTTTRFFILARRLPIDILLLFFLAGTAFFLARAVARNSRANWAVAYLLASLAFLTKGPIGVVIPAASFALWSFWARRFRFSGTRAGMGALIAIAVIVPWYALVYAAHGWTYIKAFFLVDNLGRFASEDFGPARNFLFYIPTFFADFFPWSLLAIWAMYSLWKNSDEPVATRAFGTGFPLAWCCFVFLFFSLARNKQEYYIAAMYPMMAVLISFALAQTMQTPGSRWRRSAGLLRWTYAAIAATMLGLVILLLVALQFLPRLPLWLRLAPCLILLTCFVALIWQIARRSHAQCFQTLSVTLTALFLCASAMYLPAMEGLRPVKELCRTIASEAKPGDEAGYFRATAPSMVYYLRRPIFEEYNADAMVSRLRSPGRVLCVMSKPDYDYFVRTRKLTLYLWDRRPRLTTQLHGLLRRDAIGEESLLLISNRPKPDQGGRVSP